MHASDGCANVLVTRHACSHLGWRLAFADEHPTREYTPIPFATCVYNSRHVRLLSALRVLTQSTRMYTTSEVRGASRGGCGGNGGCALTASMSRAIDYTVEGGGTVRRDTTNLEFSRCDSDASENRHAQGRLDRTLQHRSRVWRDLGARLRVVRTYVHCFTPRRTRANGHGRVTLL